MFEWAYTGVDSSVPGNGGTECAEFLPMSRRLIETVLTLAFAFGLISWGFKNISVPTDCRHVCVRNCDTGKKVLLVLVCLMWGTEIGFKLASQTVIYLLNPCHITTAIQIYLLTAEPSRGVTVMYRLHLNFLNGALLACLFPVTESRVLPCETSIYWIQHTMMVVVPYYLLRLGGVYTVEKFSDFSWCSLSYGINLAYHFLILQPIAIPTKVNLNHILCPTPLDPFYGQNYRALAVMHQSLLCPIVCKSFIVISSWLIRLEDSIFHHSVRKYVNLENSSCARCQVTSTDPSQVNGNLHKD